MKQLLNIALLLSFCLVHAQMHSIEGRFPLLRGNEIVLRAYNGFKEQELANTHCDSIGHFVLNYPAGYTGAALLKVNDGPSVIVLLHKESIGMQWDAMQDIATLRFTDSPENEAFAAGIAVHAEAEQKLAGLRYLLPLYQKQPELYRLLQTETELQELQFTRFTGSLPAGSYAAYYLKTRKLLTDMVDAAQKGNGDIARFEADFKNIDFGNDYLWHSGLMAELFAGMYQLTGSLKDREEMYVRLNAISDAWIRSLSSNAVRQQEVAEYCFKMLEQQNLTRSSEYIALAMLGDTGCQLTDKQTNLYEQYRKMAVGATAPDILLPNGAKLSTLRQKYKLVVFGASWCPDCQRDYPALVGVYKNASAKHDIQFVYVSLDIDKKAYREFYKEAPFISYCDTKGWDSPAAKNYYVVATPSYFLLDENLKIVAKLKAPEELYAYLK